MDKLFIDPGQIHVSVTTDYLPSHSSPAGERYTYAYTITITNNAPMAVQLMTRHWIITNANEEVQEVRGEGVVGEQPIIQPGASYRYTSGSTMDTPVGFMEGSYQMVVANVAEKLTFDVPIPAFPLHAPNALH